MKIPIGFKTANPAKTDGIVADFYTPLIAAGIAPVVMSIDHAGHCYDVQRLVVGTPLEKRAVMHFRRTGDPSNPRGMDVADYNADPVADAERMWSWHISRWPGELRKDLVWTGITNEPDQERSEWLARHAFRLCELALRDGHRLTVFGWAAGTPREDAWTKPEMTRLLVLLRQHPAQLALGLHEYSYEAHTLDSPLVGRWTRVVPRPWPTIMILEFGWAYYGAPEHDTGIPQIVEAYRKWYAWPQVRGLGLWTLDKGKGGRDLPDIIHRYMGPLAATIRATDVPPLGEEPPVVPGPDPLPEPAAGNVLANGSFEDGWYHPGGVPELQMPNGWTLKWRDGNEPGWANPFDGAAHSRFVRPEIRTLPEDFLPAEERPLFIRDGRHTLKVFKGAGSIYFTLMQTVTGLPGGRRWRVTVPVYPDLVKSYDNGRKVWADDPNAGLIRVRVGPFVVTGTPGDGPFGGGWVRLRPGESNEPAAEFDVTGETADVKVDFLLPFALPQNGIFTDDWTMAEARAVPEPPPVEPPVEPARPVKIVDISRWQVTIDPARMKAAGVDGVMVRASYAGVMGSKADERAGEYVAALKAAGIPWGFFHYFHPARPVDEQYAAFAAVVRRHGYGLRLALDLEEMNGFAAGTPEAARQFAARMAADFPLPDGKRHLIYTSLGYWRGRLGSPAWGANYDLWIAAWTAAATPVVPAPWTRWTLWQYTSVGDGAAHGVGSARIDLNRFNGTAAGFAAWQVNIGAGETGVPLASALWAAAAGQAVFEWQPDNALARAILADGFIPAGDEYTLVHDGVTWVYQIGMTGDRKTRRVYYAERGKWIVVKWIAGPAATPPAPPADDGRIDLAPYLRGDGRLYEVRHPGGATETFQTQSGAGGVFYQTKNRQWEALRVSAGYIHRGMDTSPGPHDGRERFYIQYEPGEKDARWCPRRMRAGETWAGSGHRVQFYDKAGCTPLAAFSGAATNRMTLVGRHAAMTWNGITIEDVIEMTNGTETWFYGRGWGLVAWRSAWGESAVAALHEPGARPDNEREVIPCADELP